MLSKVLFFIFLANSVSAHDSCSKTKANFVAGIEHDHEWQIDFYDFYENYKLTPITPNLQTVIELNTGGWNIEIIKNETDDPQKISPFLILSLRTKTELKIKKGDEKFLIMKCKVEVTSGNESFTLPFKLTEADLYRTEFNFDMRITNKKYYYEISWDTLEKELQLLDIIRNKMAPGKKSNSLTLNFFISFIKQKVENSSTLCSNV